MKIGTAQIHLVTLFATIYLMATVHDLIVSQQPYKAAVKQLNSLISNATANHNVLFVTYHTALRCTRNYTIRPRYKILPKHFGKLRKCGLISVEYP